MTTTTTETEAQAIKRQDTLIKAVNLAGDAELALARLVNELDRLGANPYFAEKERAAFSGLMGVARTFRQATVGIGDAIKQIATGQ